MPTTHIIVKGKVQGVFFRATAKKIADEIGVSGWIKNTWDDDVEAIVTGTKEQLEGFISWCKKGPPMAKVRDVIITPQMEMKFEGFLVKH